MYKEFFTLRKKSVANPMKDDIYAENGDIVKFNSYEEAYDKMVNIYLDSLKLSYSNPDGHPIRYGIWRTAESDGSSYSQACWR